MTPGGTLAKDRDLRWRVKEALRLRLLQPAQLRLGTALERLAPRAAESLFVAAERAARLTHRDERSALPSPIEVDGIRIDTLDDLQTFTGLPRHVVADILTTRRHLSFRAEWLGTPQALRTDHWFYLSSKSYLLNNAVHFPDASFVDMYILPFVPPAGRILDFGAGTGELALRCAARGLHAACIELNALQREFIRFRVDRHALQDRIEVLDSWQAPPAGAFDAVVAVDVLEHLPSPAQILDDTLLPCLAADGVLVEHSPFVVSSSNPMHHQDFGLEDHLHHRGLAVALGTTERIRVWRRDVRINVTATRGAGARRP